MPRANPQAQSTAKYHHPNYFVEVFDAAWVVVGRRDMRCTPTKKCSSGSI
jgi:hypothetical protein